MSAAVEPANLVDVVRARAKTRGDVIVFEFEGRKTSFAEFDRLTNRVANGLKALGVKPHERIAYLGKNSDTFFELLIGAMKATKWTSPRGPMMIDPETRDTVETIYIKRVEKVGGTLVNVEIDNIPNVKDPVHEAMKIKK